MAMAAPARAAMIGFSLSEKVMSGLLGATCCAQQAAALEGLPRQGALALTESLIGMVMGETLCARRLTAEADWDEAVQFMDKARVMIRSGVPQEAPFHLTRALRLVAGIGERAARRLQDLDLL
jgi:hypothetical protein